MTRVRHTGAAGLCADASASAMNTQTDCQRLLLSDWSKEEEVGASGKAATTHLWEESWDDDDTTDDFSVQLK
jgi:26 proteasome complex subunit DSS1